MLMSNMDLARGFSKLSAADRSYVLRVAADLSGRRRGRRKGSRNRRAPSASRKSMPASSSKKSSRKPRSKAKQKKSAGLIASGNE